MNENNDKGKDFNKVKSNPASEIGQTRAQRI
jgi:hypothetical protein